MAAEMDEIQLCKIMIDHGIRWDKVYTVSAKVVSKMKAINCLDIAIGFKSTSVITNIKEHLM
jgi:hypothetical protein